MQNFLLFSFLVLETIASEYPQENALPIFPEGSIEDPTAGLSDIYLTASDDRGIESSWENNDVGLPTPANGPLINNKESPIVVDERADCVRSNNLPAPGRLRRRDQEELFCKPMQEYRETTTTSPAPSNTKKEGAFLPPPNDEIPRLWPDLRQNTEMTKLWVQLNTLPGIDGDNNEEVCKTAKESLPGVARHVPVCFPHPYSLDSPSDVVQPCRLCE